MSINFYPYIRKPNSNTWDLPNEVNQEPQHFEISLSSSNAMDVLDALGLTETYSTEPLPIDAFSGLVTASLRRHLGRQSPAIPAIIDDHPGQVLIIHGARRAGYIEGRLGDLAILVQRSKEIGATHIGWG